MKPVGTCDGVPEILNFWADNHETTASPSDG